MFCFDCVRISGWIRSYSNVLSMHHTFGKAVNILDLVVLHATISSWTGLQDVTWQMYQSGLSRLTNRLPDQTYRLDIGT